MPRQGQCCSLQRRDQQVNTQGAEGGHASGSGPLVQRKKREVGSTRRWCLERPSCQLWGLQTSGLGLLGQSAQEHTRVLLELACGWAHLSSSGTIWRMVPAVLRKGRCLSQIERLPSDWLTLTSPHRKVFPQSRGAGASEKTINPVPTGLRFLSAFPGDPVLLNQRIGRGILQPCYLSLRVSYIPSTSRERVDVNEVRTQR